ncbi:RNA-binding S4 domain-containing protein [Marinicella gelatinilytica]|uniref:RNA-binding S4 domain-containing protein n=1 Tax=Marinicella gelatinilytica TaxID=2996017 RepID=UPI002260A1D2|nr:S4 domain-containing protein [Marinicella gelatinilytica]MCX7544864.1 S4 domain-containing protein [Marinicella gelatinilytica]
MVRIDKWLWAARFFKTRSLAKKNVEQGKIKVNGQRCKPARTVDIGDQISIKKSQAKWVVDVLELSEQRGPAKVAQTLYQETAASQKEREDQQLLNKLEYHSTPKPDGRPSKKDRREIQKFKKKF